MIWPYICRHILAFMEQTVDFLPWIHNLNDTLGLFNGSLYEVLQDDSLGSGSAKVSAIGLNVTCGYLAGTNTHILREESPSWEISFESHIPPALVDSAGMYLFLQKSIINCLSGPNLIITSGRRRFAPAPTCSVYLFVTFCRAI
jgi:hypothetical protein